MFTPFLASLAVTTTLALQQTAVTNVTVIDPEKGTATAGRVVIIDGERIAAVADQATVRLDGGMKRVDGTGLFAFPGLIDSHVHFGDPATFGPLSIAHGVTAVRDMGGDTETVLALRDKLNKGEQVGPRMIATGAIVDGAQPVWPFSEACATPEEGRAAVRRLKAAGVDQIKVYSKLEPDVYRAVVAEAKAVGLMAVGHVPASVTLDDAIAAGQATNEHLMRAEELVAAALPADAPRPTRSGAAGGIFSSFGYWALYPQADKAKLREALSRLAQSGMVQCPTLVVQQGIARAGDGSGERDERMASVSPAFSAFWKGDSYANYAKFVEAAIPSMKAMVGEMHEAGVPIVAGTDLANPYVFAGSSLHDELRNFVEVGMTPAEALRSATSRPAALLGFKDQGAVEPGKLASIVLARANPLESIENAAKIEHVFLAGRHFDRAALDGLLAQAKDAAQGDAAKEGAAAEAKPGELTAPGEVVVRGVYRMKFQKFDAGTEEFLITKTGDGYHIVANSNPKGGMQPPSRSRIVLGADRKVKSATWETVTESPIRAEYVVENGVVRAKARKTGADGVEADAGAQKFVLEGAASLALPVFAGDFSTVHALALEVGGKFEGKSVMWGQSGWRVAGAPYTVERKPDEKLKRGDAEITVRRYSGVLTTPGGKFEVESWIDDRGVPVKWSMKMPFGVSTAELE